jgi:hypothetical protein
MPSATYEDLRDLAGNTVTVTKGEPITIGAKPILLESPLPPQTPSTTTNVRSVGSLSSSATASVAALSSVDPWEGIGLLVTAAVVVVLLAGIFALRKYGRKS